MLRVVVSVFDSASQMYGQPVFSPSRGVAIRSFSDEVNRTGADNALNGHPEDFTLFQLAEFHEETGIFTAKHEMLCRAKDVAVTFS